MRAVVWCGTVAAWLLVSGVGRGQEDPPTPATVLRTLRADHPRLYLNNEGVNDLRRRVAADPKLAALVDDLRRGADRILKQEPSKYEIPDGRRLLSVSRRVLDRVSTLGLVYLLDGGDRYRDRAWRELEAAGNFPDWNPKHFLDTGEMSHAFGIGYDWLYDAWSPDQRQFLREALVRHGLRPGLECYRGQSPYRGWVKVEHNWNQVCNGGLTAGALAVAGEEPELAAEIVAGAVHSVRTAMAEYDPDGAYKEGPGYWSYGTTYNVYQLAALESALGTDFGLSRSPGFQHTGLFLPYMTGPTGRPFNFADAHEGRVGSSPAVAWLGHRFASPAMLAYAAARQRGTPFSVLWYAAAPAESPELPRAKYWPGAAVASLRTSWADPQATFLAFKAGSPDWNHSQCDLGTFVLEALGERWAVDLGPDNYNLPGYFDRKKGRWNFYRNRAEGHNTLVLNPGAGPDQASTALAKIARFEGGAEPFAVLDLTPGYPEARRVQRGFRLLPGGGVLVQDEVSVPKDATLYWFVHTKANVKVGGDGREAALTQNGQTLRARLLEPTAGRFTVQDAEPLPTSPRVEGQGDNRGVRKLTLRLDGLRDGRVAVWFAPDGSGTPPAVEPLTTWE